MERTIDALPVVDDDLADAAEPLLERDRRELSGAIALVASGAAVGVLLCGLQAPEALAAALTATATAAGVALRTERHRDGKVDVMVGSHLVGPR